MILILTAKAHALTPDQIVVLYNTRSQQSLEVAKFYMAARNIPKENLIAITCPTTDEIPQAIYQTEIIPQLIIGLEHNDLQDKVRCLVTTYDIPLRLQPIVPSKTEQAELDQYKAQLDQTRDEMQDAIADYDNLAVPATQPATAPTRRKPTWQTVAQELNAAANRAAHRIAALPPAEQQTQLPKMLAVQEHVGGLVGVLTMIHVRPDSPNADEGQQKLNKLQTHIREIDAQLGDLQKQIVSPTVRQKMIALRLESHGLVGQAQQLEQIIQYMSQPETESALDNELAMALADQNYPRANWIINPKNLEYYPLIKNMKDIPRTLMVTRLDGSTAENVKTMIIAGINIEKKGLDGKLYLDARGLHDATAYAKFDANMRATADWLRENSTMPVILDDTPQLLEAKNCPDAALYCGWYSLHVYHDSCQWLPGAVGYHVASSELTTLHHPDLGWVKGLLDRGFCGSLGPVSEPYLASFPKPSLFFPLLLSGEFTQGEVWQLTCPLLSWRQAYVGDPLYNPFKAHPRVKIETLKEDAVLKNAFEILAR